MRTPRLLRRSVGKLHGRRRSAVEPCEKRMTKTAFAGPPREGERKLLGSGWDPSSLQPGHLSRPHLRLGYWRPCPGSGVPRRQAAWRIAPRPPFRLTLRLQRLQRLQGASLPRLQGRKARSRPGPGRAAGPRPDGERWHAPGSLKAPKPAGPERPPCTRSGSRWRRHLTKTPRGGREARPRTKGAVEC